MSTCEEQGYCCCVTGHCLPKKVQRYHLYSGLMGGVYQDDQGHFCKYDEADKRYRALEAKLKAAEQRDIDAVYWENEWIKDHAMIKENRTREKATEAKLEAVRRIASYPPQYKEILAALEDEK